MNIIIVCINLYIRFCNCRIFRIPDMVNKYLYLYLLEILLNVDEQLGLRVKLFIL